MSFDEFSETSFSRVQLEAPILPQGLPLQGFSAFYIHLGSSEKKFHADKGMLQLCPALFGIKQKPESLFPFIQGLNAEGLIFIPRRGVTQPKKHHKGTENSWVKRFVLIFHSPFKDPAGRQKVSRLVWRTPLIRIRPGVYLAPQIRAARFQKYAHVLMRPSEYVRQLVEKGKTIWFAARLELFNEQAMTRINEIIKRTLQNRANYIIQSCHEINKEIRTVSSSAWIAHAEKRLITLRRRLKLLRWQSRFFEQEFDISFKELITRAAVAVSQVRNRLEFCDN